MSVFSTCLQVLKQVCTYISKGFELVSYDVVGYYGCP